MLCGSSIRLSGRNTWNNSFQVDSVKHSIQRSCLSKTESIPPQKGDHTVPWSGRRTHGPLVQVALRKTIIQSARSMRNFRSSKLSSFLEAYWQIVQVFRVSLQTERQYFHIFISLIYICRKQSPHAATARSSLGPTRIIALRINRSFTCYLQRLDFTFDETAKVVADNLGESSLGLGAVNMQHIFILFIPNILLDTSVWISSWCQP